jgi:hypothetical protein
MDIVIRYSFSSCPYMLTWSGTVTTNMHYVNDLMDYSHNDQIVMSRVCDDLLFVIYIYYII